MQVRKKWTAIFLAVGIAGSLAACGTGSSADKAQLVGVAMPTKEQARWVADGTNLNKEFTSLGYEVEMKYAGDDSAAQAKQIQKMIDDHVDALVIGAVDGTALKAVLAKAHSAHIPVVAYDRLIRDSGDVDYYASFNNWQVGVMEGTALLRGMGIVDASGKPTGKSGVNIEVFAGSPDDNNATFFYDGAMSVVRPFIDSGVITVPSGQVERADVAIQGWKNDVAGQRMTSLLAPYQGGTHLDGVLAPNDGIAQAVIAAVKPALGYVPVVPGQDAEIPAVKSIAAGEQFATVYKDTADARRGDRRHGARAAQGQRARGQRRHVVRQRRQGRAVVPADAADGHQGQLQARARRRRVLHRGGDRLMSTQTTTHRPQAPLVHGPPHRGQDRHVPARPRPHVRHRRRRRRASRCGARPGTSQEMSQYTGKLQTALAELRTAQSRSHLLFVQAATRGPGDACADHDDLEVAGRRRRSGRSRSSTSSPRSRPSSGPTSRTAGRRG